MIALIRHFHRLIMSISIADLLIEPISLINRLIAPISVIDLLIVPISLQFRLFRTNRKWQICLPPDEFTAGYSVSKLTILSNIKSHWKMFLWRVIFQLCFGNFRVILTQIDFYYNPHNISLFSYFDVLVTAKAFLLVSRL